MLIYKVLLCIVKDIKAAASANTTPTAAEPKKTTKNEPTEWKNESDWAVTDLKKKIFHKKIRRS